jgi:hypothetical protein
LELLQALKTLVRVDFFPSASAAATFAAATASDGVIYQRRATLNLKQYNQLRERATRKSLIIGIINHELQVAGANCCRIPFQNFERELKFPPRRKTEDDDGVDKLWGRRERV